jgi:peptidoglycan/LPS O-acetylase OafA/YrhL
MTAAGIRSTGRRIGRRKPLDGVRAIAVLAVVASHTFLRAEGGFLGVDVFFVLSGYLITSLLLKERARTGRIDFIGFYRRRVARLAPAYMLMLAVAVPMMLGPLAAQTVWPVPLAVGVTLIYAGNWANLINPDALGPLLHTWSLSIEEQFYLIWPIVFVTLLRRSRSLTGWLTAAAATGIVARAVGWWLVPGVWPYFASVTHGDGLLIGCLVAVLLSRRNPDSIESGTGAPSRAALPMSWEPAAWMAGAVLAGLMLVSRVDSGWTYTVGLTLAAGCTAVMIRHLAVAEDGPMVRALSWGPLVAIGRASYGLYLYHVPVFHLFGAMSLGYVTTIVLQCSVSAALTALSWYLVEQPAQRWVQRRRPRQHITLDGRLDGGPDGGPEHGPGGGTEGDPHGGPGDAAPSGQEPVGTATRRQPVRPVSHASMPSG